MWSAARNKTGRVSSRLGQYLPASYDNPDDDTSGENLLLTRKPWWRVSLRSTCEAVGFGLGAYLIWHLSQIPGMSLHDQRNAADGLTFTAGQLTIVQHLETRPCGHTGDEATAKGCEFDHVTTSWLPPACIDYELQAEFLALKPGGWHFWSDDDKVHEHDRDRLGFVTDEVWATNEWHMWHCLYVWRKLARAVTFGWRVDGSTLSLTHTDHCASMTGSEYATTQDQVRTLVSINFPPC